MLNKIKSDSLAARKAKDTIKATLLTTLYSEAANVGKNDGNRETTDAEVIAVIKKFLKGVDETLAHVQSEVAREEKVILEQYLPRQLSKDEIITIVTTIITNLPERNPKQMGVVMKQLKEKYDGQYDGQLASKLIKELL